MSTRVAIIVLTLFAGVAAPAQAGGERPGRSYRYAVVKAEGSVKESWHLDRSDYTDTCGRAITGRGSATFDWAMARRQPKPVTLGPFSGFHTKPFVDVEATRSADIVATGGRADCTDPAPTADACGTRRFRTRLELTTHNPFVLRLAAGDRWLFGGPGEVSCPMPADFGSVRGLGVRYDTFQTADLFAQFGPDIDITHEFYAACSRNRYCTPRRKRKVVKFTKHVVAPFKYGDGEYVADVEWAVTFKRVSVVPPKR